MSIILGLDVSTSITGVCVLDSTITPDEKGSHILHLDRIEFKGCKTLWDKADEVQRYLGFLKANKWCAVERVTLEEPLMGFRPGMSSAQTISQLMRFNGIVSYLARNIFGPEPEYFSSSHARKLCGIKLQKTSLGGPQKEQVFTHMSNNDLSHVEWPLLKSGKQPNWSRDATDAYVVARAACLEPVEVEVKNLDLCMWEGCSKKKLKGLSMCKKHQPYPA